MKMTLSKTLAAYILAAICTESAIAGYCTPYDIVTVDEGETASIAAEEISFGAYAPLAKDGEGTLQILQGGTTGAPLYVREGNIEIKGSEESPVTLYLGGTQSNSYTNDDDEVVTTVAGNIGGYTPLNIAGNNASVVIDNATVINKRIGSNSAIVVGGVDGSGSLIIQGGGYLNNSRKEEAYGSSLFVGYSGYQNVTEVGNLGWSNGHASTQEANSALSIANRYVGSYTENGFGKGEVIVTDKSKLETAFALYMCEGSFKVDGESSVIIGTEGDGNRSGGALAYQENSNSKLEILGKSSFTYANGGTSGNNYPIQFADTKNNTSVTINIIGESCLNAVGNRGTVGDTSYSVRMATNDEIASSVDITVRGGSSLNIGETLMGSQNGNGKVSVTIDDSSSYKGNELVMQKGATIDNAGTITMDTIVMNGGKLILIEGATVEGSILTVKAGAELAAGRELDVAEVSSLGLSTVATGGLPVVANLDTKLVLENNAVLTLNGGVIDMNGKDLSIASDVEISFLNYESATDENGYITIFKNVGRVNEGISEVEMIVNGIAVTADVNENGNVSIHSSSIPEPTTATMSLIALAALAARRRRK